MAFFAYKKLDDGTNCAMTYDGNETRVVIPDDMKISVLYDDLFKGRKEITEVVIPEGVREIGGFVFDGLDELKSLKLPESMDSMWQYAFTRCGIEEIEIPGKVHTIIAFAFNDCKNLKTVRLNKGTKKIMAWAFKGCSALTDIYVPEDLTDISDQAFDNIANVTIHRG